MQREPPARSDTQMLCLVIGSRSRSDGRDEQGRAGPPGVSCRAGHRVSHSVETDVSKVQELTVYLYLPSLPVAAWAERTEPPS